MVTLIRNGGFSMWFILAFGFVALATAAWFAFRPDAKHEGFLRWMDRVLVYSTLSGIAADVAATFYYTTNIVDANERGRTVLEGLAESTSPGIVGFSFLTLVALLSAVGRRRLDGRKT
jgi:hypothetical protein